MRDYYEVLGVPREADADAIKRAYRKLALEYHPDRNGGDKEAEERFKEATEAYEVLRDPEKRSRYDRFGPAGVKGGAGAGQGGFPGGFGFEEALNIFMRDFGGLGDLFGGGGGRRGGRIRRGKDVRLKLTLPLREVVTGARRTLRIRALDPCDTCRATGSAGGQEPERCDTCDGTGQLRRVQQSVFGQVVSASVCPTCGGEGQRIRSVCPDCSGEGRVRRERTLEVEIPPGVSSNNYITLRGQGNVGPRGGPRGDVIVVLEVEDDPRFIRDGDDLVSEVEVSFSQAALGVELNAPTVEGEERIRIPAGTQAGEVVTLRGKGLPRLERGGRGDLHLRVHVWTPTDLTPEERELFERLAGLEGDPPVRRRTGGRSGFWNRVKEAFSA